MTNLYASHHKGNHTFHTNASEIKLFLAILLLSGYNPLPRKKMYWENLPDVHNESVSDAMSRNRFDAIMQNLHLCDNENPDPNDKMWKIRPLYNMINQRCLRYAPFASDLSIDESMIPYYGRNNSKQRIANKPVRIGYKMWVLAETLGYVIQFDTYQGAKFGKVQKKL